VRPDVASGSSTLVESNVPESNRHGIAKSIGSKNFTEQLILGKVAVIALQVAGFDVVDRTNIPGSVPARQGQVNGEIDMEWEYTRDRVVGAAPE
jgi:osmoprotectant transport system substrate-binding protein